MSVNVQPEIGNADSAQPNQAKASLNEAEVAHLGGWQEQDEAENTHHQTGSASSNPVPLLDQDDLVTPEQIKKEQTWWMRPTPQIVVAGTAVMALLYATFSMFGIWGSPNQNPSSMLVSTDAATIDQQVTDRIKQLTAENENFKRQQIMGEPLMQPSPKPQAQQLPPASVPAKQKVVYVATTPRRAYNPQPVLPSRPLSYSPQPSKPPARAIVKVSPVPKVEPEEDPMKRVMAAANVGSYGGGVVSPITDDSLDGSLTESVSSFTQEPTDEATKSDRSQLSGGTGTVPSPSISPDSVGADEPTSIDVTQLNTSENNSPNGYAVVSSAGSLIVGTRTEGKLETPIAWSGQLQNPSQKFLIRLSKPLKAGDGSIAFKKDSYLVAQVETATDGGIIQMSAVAILSTSKGRTIEQPLPQGAILILGKGGKPLQAKSDRRDRLGNNLGIALLSGAATAASVANQVSSQSIYSSGGTFQSSTKTDDPNYAAGFGQGITQSLATQMQNRSQRTQQRLNSQPIVFTLNQGTSVQIFVNQTVSL